MNERNPNIPTNWYECKEGSCPDERGARYEFPLPEVPNAPKPSQANYEPRNIAWLIEFLGNITGYDKSQIGLRYENNSPNDKSDDIVVYHPNDKNYLNESSVCNFEKSAELIRYEKFAKKSKILKDYQDNSPANIEFFKPIC